MAAKPKKKRTKLKGMTVTAKSKRKSGAPMRKEGENFLSYMKRFDSYLSKKSKKKK